ncbi:MAG: hypothetical protein K2O18_11320, partial [Oscillospiraceae bacterium]|nr:hypothetical protein [Oscillospiraceae bacterium]
SLTAPLLLSDCLPGLRAAGSRKGRFPFEFIIHEYTVSCPEFLLNLTETPENFPFFTEKFLSFCTKCQEIFALFWKISGRLPVRGLLTFLY